MMNKIKNNNNNNNNKKKAKSLNNKFYNNLIQIHNCYNLRIKKRKKNQIYLI